MQVRLTGDMAAHYDMWYRVHVQNIGWLGWVKNGGQAGTQGRNLRVEAYQVVLVPKNAAAPGSTVRPFVS